MEKRRLEDIVKEYEFVEETLKQGLPGHYLVKSYERRKAELVSEIERAMVDIPPEIPDPDDWVDPEYETYLNESFYYK